MKKINHHRGILLAIVISFVTYMAFYGNFLSPKYNFWSSPGQVTDAQSRHMPARTYLYESIIKEKSFPFWTEKMYSGFPIYADLENAYLNPINVLSVLVLGPLWSYKILHIVSYLLGSLSLYVLLKRRGLGLLGYAVANVIFYFNTFLINHQIHYNMIMALFLFPTTLLLADLYLEKRQLRYIVLESLVIANAVLWGHMQSVAMMLIALFVYMIIFSYKRVHVSAFIFFFLALFALVTIETLPQVLPTYELFSQSSRGEGTDYLKGSLNPQMAIFSFVPYLLGESYNFIGRNISVNLRYNEIYFYSGISAAILSIFALLLLKKSREVIMAIAFVWIFLLFGFMESNKLFPASTPLITFFREWERTAILYAFGLAFLVGLLIEKLKDISFEHARKGFLIVLAPFVYIMLLARLNGGKIGKKLDFYTSFSYIYQYPYFSVIAGIGVVLLVTIIAVLVVKKYYPALFPKTILLAKIIIVSLVLFDLGYFSADVLHLRLQDTSGYKLATVPSELQDKRVILRYLDIQGMETLYYSNWSPLGTSQLKESDYVDYYGELGLDLRGVTSSILEMPADITQLKDAGIVAVMRNSGNTTLIDSPFDLIKNTMEGKYLEKKEGAISMQIQNPNDTMVQTYLKYNKNWIVTVDGKEVKIVKNGMFFDFPLDQGEHVVKIVYYPKPFIRGLLYSITLLMLLVGAYYVSRKGLYKNILYQK